MSQGSKVEEHFMARAIELARNASGKTHPNPLVGALIVESGEVVAEGWHHAAGEPHAEVEAIRNLGRPPNHDAILYVTLEPCSTVGRTGACTDAIRRSGIKRVVVGTNDPNPAHAGRGLDLLRKHGVEVTSGVMEEACADLNLIFNHWIQKKTCFFAMKIATTLDGKFCAANGSSKWITGEKARADVMLWRRYFPAIVVSASTVLTDNPSLTVRLGDQIDCPRRFVLDRSLSTLSVAHKLKVYTDDFYQQTTVVCSQFADQSLKQAALDRKLTLWELPEIENHLDFDALRAHFDQEGITGVYFETGPRLTTALLEGRKVNYLFHYLAPKYQSDLASVGIGTCRQTQSMDVSIPLKNVQHLSLGDDFLIRGHV
ncbi:MAG: bifunctional diaminohydroxyphosphoribosylaminopyrimidine deaminase/5-amino-6-(5-phosphoribosylamino)uracil reductase RibD [Verrucomicrobiota bacterium]